MALISAPAAQADEGRWKSYQLPQLKSELKRIGIAIPAEKLADLSKHPIFDSTYESITKDWYFDRDITRAIHMDIRYMPWIMSEVDHADNVLKEMAIKYPARKK